MSLGMNRAVRRLAGTALAAGSVLSLGACALPRVTQRPAQVEYRLLAPSAQQAATGAHPVILRVLAVQAAPGLGGVDMLYSPHALQLMPYRDSRWLVPPGEMITAALRQSLARQPWVAAVEDEASPAAAALTLRCSLDRLEHDVYSARVVLHTRCQLFDDADSKLRATWGFAASRDVGRQDAAGYAQATQDLLDGLVAQALRHIAAALPADQAAPAAAPASSAH